MRVLALLIGLAALAAGGVAIVAGALPPALVFAGWGVLIVAGTLHERRRYKTPEAAAPSAAGWERTDERFIDEETGRPVTVYLQARTGERKYVRE